jgi:nickel-dependent lactate racemase
MKHVFPHAEYAPLEIPDGQLSGLYSMRAAGAAVDPRQLIAVALANPIGSPRLRDRVQSGMKVVVVVDDNTRTTRTDLMLPAVIVELRTAGVAQADIQVLVALGTHRAMTAAEVAAKYTPEMAAQYHFVFPNWKDPGAYAAISTAGNFEIRIHRQLLAADFVVGIGQTAPHLIAGFGGGCKIINPGCADPGTIGRMHWLCHTVADGQLFAVRDNAVRQLIDEVGVKAGLKFIINEVPGPDDAVTGVFAGDSVLAHRAACDFARTSCAVPVAELTDIVVADAYPSDSDFWQSLKGLNTACSVARPGGTVVFVTPCPEGVAPHPEIAATGFRLPVSRIQERVATGQLDPIPAAAIWLGTRMLERAKVILVSKGVTEAEATAMGLAYAPDPSAALAQARRQHGPRARINVLYKAAKLICSIT